MRYSLSLILVLMALVSSCSKSDKLTLVDSTGRINHVLIVMNNEDWEGRVGDSLRQIIAQPLPGLPQEEFPFTVNQVDPLTFNSLFKTAIDVVCCGDTNAALDFELHNSGRIGWRGAAQEDSHEGREHC